jgi:hypothetical protein
VALAGGAHRHGLRQAVHGPVGETIYDMQGNRYLAQAFNNEDQENVEKEFNADYFSPGNVTKQVTK